MNQYLSVPEAISGIINFSGQFSVILPVESRNMILNPSLETNATGYTLTGGATTIARTALFQRRGVYGLRVTPAIGVDAGVYYSTLTTVAGGFYTFSVDILGTVNDTYHIFVADNAGAAISPVITFKGKGFWQRPSVSYTDGAGAANRRVYVRRVNGGSASPFYVDGFQFENLSYPTTYIDGDQEPMTIGRNEYFWDGIVHASTSYRIADTRAGGREVYLTDLGFDVMAVQGLGLAPVDNIANELNLGGSSYQNTITKERTFTLAGTIQAGKESMPGLMDIRANLINAFSPVSTALAQPLKLGFHDIRNCNEVHEPIYFVCSYVSGLEGVLDNPASERANLVFTEWLPCGYEDGERAVELQTKNILSSIDYIIRRDNDTGVWESVVTTPPNGRVYAMAEGKDGTIYFGGAFTSFGGVAVNRICSYNPGTKVISAMGAGGGANNGVFSIAVGPDGMVYIGGTFTQVNGAAANGIAKWNPNTSTWSYFTVGANTGVAGGGADVWGVAVTSSNILCIGGDFTSATGVVCNNFAWWNNTTATFVAVGAGTNGIVRDLWTAKRGTRVLIAGDFTTLNAVAANTVGIFDAPTAAFLVGIDTGLPAPIGLPSTTKICHSKFSGRAYCLYTTGGGGALVKPYKYVGSTWTALTPWGAGMNSYTIRPDYNTDGVHLGFGAIIPFLFYGDGQAFYNGSSFYRYNIDVNGTPVFDYHLDTKKWLYASHDQTGNAVSTRYTDITMRENEIGIPIFQVHGQAGLERFENAKAQKVTQFDYILASGDTAYLNYDTSRINFLTAGGVNLTSYLVSPSSITGYGFRRGYRTAGVFLGGNDSWIETGDNNNQLDRWEYLDGLTFENTDNHKIYITIIEVAAGVTYSVNIYKNVARAAGDLIGHTANYNTNGYKAIVEDNSSGLSGWIYVTARTAADVDIEVSFGYVYLRWTPMYHSIDEVMA